MALEQFSWFQESFSGSTEGQSARTATLVPNCTLETQKPIKIMDSGWSQGPTLLGEEWGNKVQRSLVQRQERVPVVKTITRISYKCANCQQFVGSKNFYSQEEDFGPTQQQTVVQREVLRIPCRYCKTLLDPIREKTCPHCGSVVST